MARPPSDQRQKAALAKIARKEADVERLLDDTVRIVEWTLEAKRNEMTSGLSVKGGKSGTGRSVIPEDIKALGELARMIDTLVAAKERWLKVAKAAAGRLTPAEVLEAAVQRILRLDPGPRLATINRLIAEHSDRRDPSAKAGFTKAPIGPAGESAPLLPQPQGPGPRTALDAIADIAAEVP